ncbi:uncharacterized protein LOC132746295 [Ruditapes philippinarum]|uniref:uncharacterized protein LOC132746295 n=1 Tax=Ruditapes philippinarum TaxID=129788 RepID=UPI00295BA01A|nr:uncharacterized protein LOC132746295 [Ruditapes philippinarum]
MWTNNSREETKLHLAETESYSTGKIKPLLKEELKYYIQTRRMSEGKNELVVEFNKEFKKDRICLTIYKLRPNEVVKLKRRREQNRKASEKFRVKKKTELQTLQLLCQKLQQRNDELMKEVADLEAERDAWYCRLLESLHNTDLIDNNKTVPI